MNEVKNYLFLIDYYDGYGYDCYVVVGQDKKDALIRFCKHEDIEGVRLDAICALPFEKALELANEWLCYKIASIILIFDDIYGSDNLIKIPKEENKE